MWLWSIYVLSILCLTEGRLGRQLINKRCPEGFQLSFNRQARKLECDCLKYHVYWHGDGTCYPEYTRGPCPKGQHIVMNPAKGEADCMCLGYHLKWEDAQCYEEHTQGPCDTGNIFVRNPLTGQGECTCDKSLTFFYHPDTKGCYELYRQGPCKKGQILKFNYKTFKPECMCQEGYVPYGEGGGCYQLNTRGPCDETKCKQGTISCFVRNIDSLKTECKCLPTDSYLSGGLCFEPYTRAICLYGQWLVYKNKRPVCEPKGNCKRYDNWFFWEQDYKCYRQYSKGPCKDGELFYLDPTTGEVGCNCKEEWKPYYYDKDGGCYEQMSVGPCSKGFYFGFNRTSGKTECNCFQNHVLNSADGLCYEKFTRGPCPEGKLVQENPVTQRLQCSCVSDMIGHYWSSDGQCYQHYERGPCKLHQQFRADKTTGKAICIDWKGKK